MCTNAIEKSAKSGPQNFLFGNNFLHFHYELLLLIFPFFISLDEQALVVLLLEKI